MRGLVRSHDKRHAIWQEPHHAFCEVVQALGLAFGFINLGEYHVYPTRDWQDQALRRRIDWVHPYVFAVVRDIANSCCTAEELAPWQITLARWYVFGGKTLMILEVAQCMEGVKISVGERQSS